MEAGGRVVFTATRGAVRDELWCDAARETAARLGLTVALNTFSRPVSTAQWAELLAEAEAVISTWGAPRLDGSVLERNTCLRFVGHAAGSVAGIVSPELRRRGVRVSSANREMAESVARWCLMMTMVAMRNLLHYAQFGVGHGMNAGNRHLVRDPRECSVAVWGYGHVAQAFIRMVKPHRPKELLVADGYLTEEMALRAGVTKASVRGLFERADVILLLQSLTEQTRHVVDQEHLASIRDGAALINAGRAHLVQPEALISELLRGRFTGIFDVHHTEPLPAESPFRHMPNVILTPHCAGREGRSRYVGLMLEEYDRLRRGEPLQYEISARHAASMTRAC